MYSFVNVCIWNIKQFVLELRVENGVLYLLELVLIAPMIVVHLHIISNGRKKTTYNINSLQLCAVHSAHWDIEGMLHANDICEAKNNKKINAINKLKGRIAAPFYSSRVFALIRDELMIVFATKCSLCFKRQPSTTK